MQDLQKKKIIILGSTGSVGKQVLDVVDAFPNNFEVVGLSAYSNKKLLSRQIQKYKPKFYHLSQANNIEKSISYENGNCRYIDSLENMAEQNCDLLISAVSGIAGLLPVLKALENGTDIAIANKEAIVCGGNLLNSASKKTGAKILPLDSEHSALWQCLWGEEKKYVKNLIITASGGAFRNMSIEQISKTTGTEALNHPVWKMGKKVTIDSATLFNKGLEVVEASKLFDISINNIQVLQHPESLVHGMIQFSDNSLKASIASPDMCLPIQVAMFYPNRSGVVVDELDFVKVGKFHFNKVDTAKFPCLNLVIEAGKKGTGAMTALSAADEVLVEQYLQNKIGFYDISNKLEKTLQKFENEKISTLEEIFDIDKQARQYILL